jgi:hypothetical protein
LPWTQTDKFGKRGFKTKFGRKPQWKECLMKIETIYLVYENSDKTEGRGPMRHIPDSGFFTDEDAAWNFADTQAGIMGRKPQGASWRLEKYPDVQVRSIDRHDGDYHTRKSHLTSRINQLKNELYLLEQERKQDKPNAS